MASLRGLLEKHGHKGFRNIIKCHLPISHTLVEELEIALPKVTHDLDGYQRQAHQIRSDLATYLSTGEAAHWNYHCVIVKEG
jgi:hypothetical protein